MTWQRVHPGPFGDMMRERGMMRDRGDALHSSGNDVQDKRRSQAHRALRESRSVDRVWNFALEELGRMNINFDPSWMSGKKQNSQNSQRISVGTVSAFENF